MSVPSQAGDSAGSHAEHGWWPSHAALRTSTFFVARVEVQLQWCCAGGGALGAREPYALQIAVSAAAQR